MTDAAKNRIYDLLNAQSSQFNSTIALLTLRRTRKRVRRFNFDFRICQIQRETYDNENPFAMPKQYETISSLPSIPVAEKTYNDQLH